MPSASANDDVWFSLLPHGATVHDQSGAVVRFNPAAPALLGLTEDQLAGRSPYDPQWHVVNENLSPCPPSQLPGVRALAGKPIEALLGVFLVAEGRYRWLQFHSRPHDGPEGRRVLSLFEDVTRSKRTQDEARLERQLFERGPVVVLQRRGTPARLVYVSDNFQSVFGFHPAPYLSGDADLWERVHPDDRVAIAHQREQIHAGLGFADLSGQLRLQAGPEEWRLVEYRTIFDPGGPGREPSSLAYWMDRTNEAMNHRRLAMALEAASTGTWEWTGNARKLELDAQARTQLGLTNDPASLADWEARIHPEDRPEWDSLLAQVQAGHNPEFDLKVRQQVTDGWRWMRVHGRTVETTADGRAYRVLGTLEDIHAIVTTEEERLLLSQVVEQGPAAVVITDGEGVISYINQQFTALTGFLPADLVGRVASLFRSSPGTPTEGVWDKLRTGQAWLGELQTSRKDGTPLWVQASISPIRGQGATQRYVGQLLDITERRGVEEASRSQFEFQLFLTQAAARLLVVRQEADQALNEILGDLGVLFQADRVLIGQTSGSCHVTHGWDRVGTALPETLDWGSVPLWTKKFADGDSVAELQPVTVPWSSRPQAVVAVPLSGGQGEPSCLLLEAATARLRWDNAVISVTVVAQTLTTFLKRLADEADVGRARKEADAANQAKSDFLAHMSHEIRTPMNGILGLAELALTKSLDEEVRPLIEGLKGSGEALLELVNDILDVSKIEAGKLELEDKDFSLKHLVTTVLAPLRLLASNKGLGLDLQWNLVRERRRGDPTRVRQILNNLISNAIKFTAKGGVTVSVDAGEDEVVRIAVRDTGPGVPVDKQQKLFQQYSQTEASTSRRFGGTGLGLSICRQLVERMGGGIGYSDAKQPSGGLFWFALPLPVAEASPVAAAVETARPYDLSVLVVEDNLVNQRVASGLLKRHGIEPVLASDGREALNQLKAGRFDLVLMDMQMPVMDGLTATRGIRAGEGGDRHRHVTVVAMTANAMQEDREAGLAAGMDDYVTKPVAAAKLAELLERWGQRRSDQDETRRKHTFDADEMRSRLQMEDEFIRQIVQLFYDDLPLRRQGLVEAWAGGNLAEVRRLSHNLKGTASNLVAQAVVEAAGDLEAAAVQADLALMGAPYRLVLGEIDQLRGALSEFLR